MLIYLVLFFSSFVFAQSNDGALSVCAPDDVRFCSALKASDDHTLCLFTHSGQVSHDCRESLERLAKAREDASYRGGGALTSFGGLNAFGATVPLLTYDGRFLPNENGPTFVENKANLSLPVYHTSKDTVGVSLAGGDLHLGDQLHLDTGAAVPTDLTRVEAGVQYNHQLDGNKSWSVRGSVGYAGDKSFDVMSFGLSATYGYPATASAGYWVYMVFLGNNNALINYVPVPGFGYVYKTPTLTGIFGFPVTMLQWTPAKQWLYSFSAFGANIQAEAAHGVLNHFQTFAQYNFSQQTYIPSQRPEDTDRLIIREQKVGVGFRTPLAHLLLSEFQIGRSYDRSIFLGKSILRSDNGSVDLGPDWFVTWGLKYAF